MNTHKQNPNETSPISIRLPRQVESDPRGPAVVEQLFAKVKPLWRLSEVQIPELSLNISLSNTLFYAQKSGFLVRGLEGAEKQLESEERGLKMVDRKSGIDRGQRISRILVITNDAAERFYRRVETVLRLFGTRVLAIRLEVDENALGELLFGPGASARAVLLTHKQAVSSALFAILEEQ